MVHLLAFLGGRPTVVPAWIVCRVHCSSDEELGVRFFRCGWKPEGIDGWRSLGHLPYSSMQLPNGLLYALQPLGRIIVLSAWWNMRVSQDRLLCSDTVQAAFHPLLLPCPQPLFCRHFLGPPNWGLQWCWGWKDQCYETAQVSVANIPDTFHATSARLLPSCRSTESSNPWILAAFGKCYHQAFWPLATLSSCSFWDWRGQWRAWGDGESPQLQSCRWGSGSLRSILLDGFLGAFSLVLWSACNSDWSNEAMHNWLCPCVVHVVELDRLTNGMSLCWIVDYLTMHRRQGGDNQCPTACAQYEVFYASAIWRIADPICPWSKRLFRSLFLFWTSLM